MALGSTRQMEDKTQLVELTADIAAAYLSANTVAAAELPGLIQTIHNALSGVTSGAPAPAPTLMRLSS